MTSHHPPPTSTTTGTTATMQAVVQDRYGEAHDVLRLQEVDRPTAGPDEVLLRVRAAGVDRGVWHLMAGVPYAVRLTGLRGPRSRVRGREVAGRVEAVGAGVRTLRPGDEVFGIGAGTFAEYATASVAKLAPAPANVSAAQAALVPVSGTTALQAVRDHARVRPGQSVLVIGASGGVGTFAVQIAKAYGAEVTGVCSTGKTDLVRSIGADHVVDHRRTDLAAEGRRYDVVLDIGGNRSLRALRRLLTPSGTLVLIGGEDGGRWLGLGRQLLAVLRSPFARQRLRMMIATEKRADLLALAEIIEAGTVTPVLDRTFPLAGTADAVTHLTDGRARGKVAVVP
jgi:NADPH:quinone reductase-like Zn-dependent oxidoreductase